MRGSGNSLQALMPGAFTDADGRMTEPDGVSGLWRRVIVYSRTGRFSFGGSVMEYYVV